MNLWTKRALLLVSLLTIPTAIALIFAYPVLRYLLGQGAEIAWAGTMYSHWLILGLWPTNLTVVLQKFLQAQGVLWPIIWQGIVANIVNVVAQSALIWGAGMGLKGSAVGMGIARIFQLIHISIYIAKREKMMEREKLQKVAEQVERDEQRRMHGIDPDAVPSSDDPASDAHSSETSRGDQMRSHAHSAVHFLRSSSLRLVSDVRSGVADSAHLVASGVRGSVHYAQNPREFVSDLHEKRVALMEGVWNRAALKQFISIGVSSGATTGIESWAFDGIGIAAASLTVVELDAHYVLLNTALTCYFTLPLGISIAASIRVGHLVGMGHVRTAQLTSKLVAISGAGFMACSGFCLSLARNSIGYVFSNSAQVVAQVARIAPICGLFQVFDGIQGSTGGVLRGLGLQKWAAVINFCGLWIIGVPAGCLLAFPAGLGLPGLWWGLLIGLFCLACGNLLLLWRADWHLQVEEAQKRIAIDRDEYENRRKTNMMLQEGTKEEVGEGEGQGTSGSDSAYADVEQHDGESSSSLDPPSRARRDDDLIPL